MSRCPSTQMLASCACRRLFTRDKEPAAAVVWWRRARAVLTRFWLTDDFASVNHPLLTWSPAASFWLPPLYTSINNNTRIHRPPHPTHNNAQGMPRKDRRARAAAPPNPVPTSYPAKKDGGGGMDEGPWTACRDMLDAVYKSKEGRCVFRHIVLFQPRPKTKKRGLAMWA